MRCSLPGRMQCWTYGCSIWGETFKFHLIPSGILYSETACVIGPGTVIAPDVLKKELDSLLERGITVKRLYISPRAHITLPYHVELDGKKEDLLGEGKIELRCPGIGPTYEDKVSRIGLRIGDLLLPDEILLQKLQGIAEQKNPVLERVFGLAALKPEEMMTLCEYYRSIMGAYVADTDEILAKAMAKGNTILLEGAQGTMLDSGPWNLSVCDQFESHSRRCLYWFRVGAKSHWSGDWGFQGLHHQGWFRTVPDRTL